MEDEFFWKVVHTKRYTHYDLPLNVLSYRDMYKMCYLRYQFFCDSDSHLDSDTLYREQGGCRMTWKQACQLNKTFVQQYSLGHSTYITKVKHLDGYCNRSSTVLC